MKPSQLTRVVVLIVTSIYSLAIYLTHSTLKEDSGSLLSYLPSAVAVGVLAFDLWIWKLPGVHYFVGRPRIGGTWFGTLEPNKDSKIPTGGNRGPIQAALVITQSYWSIGVTLMTSQSASQSTSTGLRADSLSPGRRVLAYTYANNPAQKQRPRSQPHLGAVELHIVGREPVEFEGTYWTDRLTAGDMKFRRLDSSKDYPTFDAALAAATAAGLA